MMHKQIFPLSSYMGDKPMLISSKAIGLIIILNWVHMQFFPHSQSTCSTSQPLFLKIMEKITRIIWNLLQKEVWSKINFLLQSCGCPNGFKLVPDSHSCVGIDECKELATRPCSQMCVNKNGTYSCSCYPHYLLNNDGKSCKVTGKTILTTVIYFVIVCAVAKQIIGFLWTLEECCISNYITIE